MDDYDHWFPSLRVDNDDDDSYAASNTTMWTKVFSSGNGNEICLIIEAVNADGAMQRVHIVEDAKLGQVYVVKTLTTNPHFQLLKSNLIKDYFTTIDDAIPVHFYSNKFDHSDDFIMVINDHHSNGIILDQFDFPLIKSHVINYDYSLVADNTRQKKNRVFYGYCSNVCTSRNDVGVSFPKILNGTMESFVQSLFVAMSTIHRYSLLPEWARYPVTDEYRKFFDHIIRGNTWQSLSPAVTDIDNLVTTHMDTQNPKFGPMAAVATVSRWVGEQRVSITAYNRNSLDSAIQREKTIMPILTEFSDYYKNLRPHRKDWNQETAKISSSLGTPIDKNHYRISCNMDLMGFLSLWIHCMAVLIQTCNLNYLGVVSVLGCFDIFPNSAYYFSLAVYDYVYGDLYNTIDQLSIGRHLAVRMIYYRDCFYESKKKNPKKVFRYNDRRSRRELDNLPSQDKWTLTALKRTTVCLYAFGWSSTKPNLLNMHKLWTHVSSLLSKIVVGAGPLSTKHFIGICATIGILPGWFATYGVVDGTVLTHFDEKIKEVSFQGNQGRLTLTTIMTYMNNKFQTKIFNLSRVENLCCKLFRHQSTAKTDGHFVDVHAYVELMCKVHGGKLAVKTLSGESFICETDVLCHKFELINDIDGVMLLPVLEISNSLLPTLPEYAILEDITTPETMLVIKSAFKYDQTNSSLPFSL